MGVCEENLGNTISAIEAYKQSKWFSATFIRKSLPELTQFISDVEKRAEGYNSLIQNVKNNQHTLREFKKKEKKSNKPNIYYDELDNIKKFEKTIKHIENLKIDDIEDDDINSKKSENIKNILSTVKVINHFMSDKFMSIINSMYKIEVNKY